MTINYFAILPKYCDCCKRTFILEKYHKRYIEVGIEYYPLKVYICDKCFKEKFK